MPAGMIPYTNRLAIWASPVGDKYTNVVREACDPVDASYTPNYEYPKNPGRGSSVRRYAAMEER